MSRRHLLRRLPVLLVLLLAVLAYQLAFAGGPILVGGPSFGVQGQPFVWDSSAPVAYRVDGGPLSRTPGGTVVIDNAAGLARVQAMFQVWQDVPTATISYTNAGAILSEGAFSDGDVSTVEEFDAMVGSCLSATQSPIMFDADGSLFQGLIGDPGVIGFAGLCELEAGTGRILSGLAALNGIFLDGLDDGFFNFELTSDEFDAVFIHEFGHFSGLDHSQVNVNCLDLCTGDNAEGLPTMFPFLLGDFMKSLAPDDIAWISRLYPEPSFATTHGTISGVIFFSDGVTRAQGVNVVARRVNDPATPQNESRRIAVSVVSGYRFTGNPGQSTTADYLPCNPPEACPGGFAGNNSGGSLFGSRDPLLVGFYEIPVPVGSYTVEVESIDPFFAFGSGVGPLSPPIPNPGVNEKWNLGESASDSPSDSSPVQVTAGSTLTDINILLNGTKPRFDALESSAVARLRWQQAPPVWFRKEQAFLAVAHG